MLRLEQRLGERCGRLRGVDDVAAVWKVVAICRYRSGGAASLHLSALEDAQRGVHRSVARRLDGNHDCRRPLLTTRRMVAGDGVTLALVVAGFFFSSRRRHTRCGRDWSSDVCSSDLTSVAKKLLPLDHQPLYLF